MSGSDTDRREVTVTADGVEVRKLFEDEQFPVPAVAFDVRSERAEPVVVRIVDDVPEDVTMDDLGFHPEYGSEFWSVGDGSITFERTFDPDETFETVYGLRVGDADAVERFLGEPRVEVTAEAERSVPVEVSDPLVRGVGAGDESRSASTLGGEDVQPVDEADTAERARTNDGHGTDEAVETDEERKTDEERETSEGDEATAEGEPAEGLDTAEETETVVEPDADDADERGPGTPDTVEEEHGEGPQSADRIDEIGIDEIEGEGFAAAPSNSVDARIEHLQSRVSDLAAYTDALESFLDENGSARRLVREQKTRTAALREDIEELEGNVESQQTAIGWLEEDIERIDETVEDVRERLDTADERFEEADAHVERTDRRFDAIDGRLDGIEERLDSTDGRLDAVEERTETLDGHLEEVDQRLSSIDDQFAAIDDRFDELDSSIETLSEDLTALQSWRSRFTAALSGEENAGDADGSG